MDAAIPYFWNLGVFGALLAPWDSHEFLEFSRNTLLRSGTQKLILFLLPGSAFQQKCTCSTCVQVCLRCTSLLLSVYSLYIGLLLSALNRLPIKLPNQKGVGRRHIKADGVEGESAAGVTFADVAGVDEAKEELQEVVADGVEGESAAEVTWAAVAGVDEGKEELQEVVVSAQWQELAHHLVTQREQHEAAARDNMHTLSRMQLKMRAHVRDQVLRSAWEANVPFFSISASEFVELYVGMGAMRVRELFTNARKEAPAIVFIDEIDAVAKGRDMRMRSVGNDEREQTLNQLLTELDGFISDKDKPVICIAATNRSDVLDPALLRPGRFDRRVSVERPDKVGREQILQVHLSRRGLPLAADVSVASLASFTTGFTGADLANLVNEAALLAGRANKSEVSHEDFDAAVLRAVAGVEKKRSIMVGGFRVHQEQSQPLVLPTMSAEVEKLSIIPRSGGALGFTYIPPRTEDRSLLFETEIRGQLAMLMGGRAAETLTCASVTTGAMDDIRRATELAARTISEFGLNSSIGPINVAALGSAVSGGDELAALLGQGEGGSMGLLVEREVKALLDAALVVAMDVVLTNHASHSGLSRELQSNERMEGTQLSGWLQGVKAPPSLREFVLLGKLPSKEHAVFVRSHAGEQLVSSSNNSGSSSSRPEDTSSWQGQQWAPA
ncbi:ATP-dependent metallopeptidase Hfl [Dunaliella salina]|uniref:ATP-dependent metallopeptidase Hfl n=1 Tax=Dunaliella salina TaxID=3046 RepID=A0ABQ7GAF1_DUNSA|nr:ATP-dependent metallopeptidase Hfl [Dunaliella salina]|eukprot:KAF5831580.1 ATP-dependent metallopeptidase Hfl [Dunaliella salina]